MDVNTRNYNNSSHTLFLILLEGLLESIKLSVYQHFELGGQHGSSVWFESFFLAHYELFVKDTCSGVS